VHSGASNARVSFIPQETAISPTAKNTKLSDGSDAAIRSFSPSGSQTVSLSSTEGIVVDARGWVGLTQLNITASNGTDFITVGDQVVLSVVDTSGPITTKGGSSVSIVQTGTGHTTVNGGAATSFVQISGTHSDGTDDVIHDLNAGTTRTNSISSVSITGSECVTWIESNALTSLVVAQSGPGSSAVVLAATGARNLGLTLNGDAATDVTDAHATTVNVQALGSASSNMEMAFSLATSISFNDSVGISVPFLYAPKATSLKIAGRGDFTGDLTSLAKTCAIDATQSSGIVTVSLSASEKFTGGSGQDIVTVLGAPTVSITGGSNAHNEIILRDAANIDIFPVGPALLSNFSTMGFAGNTSGVIFLGGSDTYTSFDIQGTGGTLSIFDVNPRSQMTIDNDNGNDIQLLSAPSATFELTLNLGTAGTHGINASIVSIGADDGVDIGTANIVSNGNGTNIVGLLITNGVSTLQLSGPADLNLQRVLASGNTSGGFTVLGASDDASITLNLADEASSQVELGRGSDHVLVGTGNYAISYGTHAAGADTTSVGANASLTSLTIISGVVLGDHLQIADATAFSATGITASQVTAAGSSAATLAGWVNGALGAAGGHIAQHSAGWFQFDGNTYVIEQAATTGTAFGVGDTLVELVGLHDLSSGGYEAGSASIVL
jgi:S-layer protein